MCRLFGFRSAIPSQAHRSLIAAENALGKQSKVHPDGWGVAFYNGGHPQIYRNEAQALDDQLFRRVSAVVSTHTLLAHIRRATTGDVNLFNCHPFQYGNWTFAHNGTIANCGVDSERYALILSQIDSKFHRFIIGTTDSELLFYLILSKLSAHYDNLFDRQIDFDVLCKALKESIEYIQRLSLADNGKLSTITVILTNGFTMIGLRCGRELNYSTYKSRCPERETCPAFEAHLCESEVHDGVVKHMILSSEHVAEVPNVWCSLENGEMAAVNDQMVFVRKVLIDPIYCAYNPEDLAPLCR